MDSLTRLRVYWKQRRKLEIDNKSKLFKNIDFRKLSFFYKNLQI